MSISLKLNIHYFQLYKNFRFLMKFEVLKFLDAENREKLWQQIITTGSHQIFSLMLVVNKEH